MEMETTKIRFGFKGRNQIPILLIWREYLFNGEVIYASVLFNSMNYIGI